MARILHVNKFLYRRGGAEAYMEDVAELQSQSGHEVAFFGMAHAENTPHRYAHSFPAQVDFDPAPATVVAKVRGVGRMLWSTSAARGISEVLDDFKPDVVHLHNIYHQLSPSILRPVTRRGIALVMTVHDYNLACPTYNFMSHGEVCESCLGGHFTQAVRKRCQGGSLSASIVAAADLAVHTRLDSYRGVDRFICPSEFMVTKMTEAGVYPERLRRLHHFVHLDQPAKSEPGNGVVFVGRLSGEKGVDLLVRALAKLPEHVQLDVLGDGPDRAQLTALADETVPGRVRFHGRQPAHEVARALRGAAVCVVPSRWYENQPLVILEAYTAGTAVVGTNLGGITELIQPGVTGELFEVGDVTGIAGKVAALVADPDGAHRMGAAGRAWVEENFTPGLHLSGLNAIYAEASGRVGAPTAR